VSTQKKACYAAQKPQQNLLQNTKKKEKPYSIAQFFNKI
jgi:hypothetical protein